MGQEYAVRTLAPLTMRTFAPSVFITKNACQQESIEHFAQPLYHTLRVVYKDVINGFV